MKTKPAIIFISFIFFSLSTVPIYTQNVMRARDGDSRGKVYVDTTLEGMIYTFEGKKTGWRRHVFVKLIGPENLQKGNEGSFYLDIIPEYGNDPISSESAEIVTNFIINMISTENFFQFMPQPKYFVVVDDNPKYQLVTDVPNQSRKLSLFLGGTIPAFLNYVPGLNILLSLSNAFGQTKRWQDAHDPDWKAVWEDKNSYDTFVILKPILSMPLNRAIGVRKYMIELPFKVIGNKGILKLSIESISTTSYNDRQRGGLFQGNSFEIINTGSPSPRKKIEIKGKYTTAASLNPTTTISIDLNSTLSSASGQNILRLEFKPKTSKYRFVHFKNINLGIELPKGRGKVSDIPQYYDFSGKNVPLQTLRQALAGDVISSWMNFGTSMLFSRGKIKMPIPKAISSANNWYTTRNTVIDIIKATNSAIESSSFSETSKSLWEAENKVNFYQLPSFSGNEQKLEGVHGFRVDIPISFYENSTDNIVVYFSGKLHFGKLGLEPGVTGIPSFKRMEENNRNFAYKIPLTFKKKKSLPTPMAIGLIIDSSGSMTDNDPQDIRKTAAGMILDQLSGKESVFLIDFDDGASWLNSGNWQNWNRDDLKRAIKQIDSNGGTNVGNGINKLKEAIENHVSAQTKAGILLLTDGLGNYNNEAEWFAKKNIPIYTISLVGEANAKLLKDIARATNGLYMKANSVNDIVRTFNQFYAHLTGNSTICVYNDHIKQGQIIEQEFHLESNIDLCFISTVWTGSKIGMTIISPSGKKYSRSSGLAEWFIGDRYISVKIKNPEAGKWKAAFEGLEIPAAGEPFHYEVNANSPLKIDLVERKSQPGIMAYELGFNQTAGSLKEVKPTITVVTPQSDTLDISDRYKNKGFTFIPNSGKGSYLVEVDLKAKDASGQPLQRHLSRTVLLGEYVPVNIAPLKEIIGNIIRVDLGKKIGNRSGVKCYLYKAGGKFKEKIAVGYVTFVMENECTVEIQQFLRPEPVSVGDIVKLDLAQWSRDQK